MRYADVTLGADEFHVMGTTSAVSAQERIAIQKMAAAPATRYRRARGITAEGPWT